jgi:uncharacterized protein (DUF58 family)
VIAPTPRLFALTLAPLALSLGLYLAPAGWPAVLAFDLVILAVAIGDATTLPLRSAFRARRELGGIATRGVRHPIEVVIENGSRRAHDLEIRDDVGGLLEEAEPPPPLRLLGRSRGRVRHVVLPRERGHFVLDRVFVRAPSRLGFWRVQHALPVRDELSVYPALAQISRYALYARLNRMSLLGVRRTRRVGSDNEFERLRDYTPDDQFKAIDWRATSRRLKLTVRDHQTNQSQRVVFAVDCGRMMVNRTAGGSLLDAALDAALTLSYVALSHRDEAGLLCFGERVLRWVPPRGGRRQLDRMIAACHDVEAELVESRFDEALLYLQRQCRKRTLVLVITNLIDDRNATSLRRHLAPTVGRHLPLVTLLRDPALLAPVEVEAPAGPALYRAAAAADVLSWRRQVLADLRHDGVLTLDVRPEQLTAAVVNEYLAIKARHLL